MANVTNLLEIFTQNAQLQTSSLFIVHEILFISALKANLESHG